VFLSLQQAADAVNDVTAASTRNHHPSISLTAQSWAAPVITTASRLDAASSLHCDYSITPVDGPPAAPRPSDYLRSAGFDSDRHSASSLIPFGTGQHGTARLPARWPQDGVAGAKTIPRVLAAASVATLD